MDVGGDADTAVAAPHEHAPLGQARGEPPAVRGEEADIAGALIRGLRRDDGQAEATESLDQLAAQLVGVGEHRLRVEAVEDVERIVEDEEPEQARVARLEPGRVGPERHVERAAMPPR